MSASLSDIYRQKIADGTLEPDAAQEAVLPEFDRIKAALEAAPAKKGLRGLFAQKPDSIQGLYIWGGVGRGKSMLMDMFYDSVLIDAKRRVHFHAFMQEVQAGLHKARQQGVDDAILPVANDIISKIRLLCFDEMQITDIADAMIVGRLFERLFDAGVTVVTTSNRVPNDLYRDGLNRDLFVPFINEITKHAVVWELISPRDYRQDRLAGEQVYFSPADATARASINAIWEHLSGGSSAPLILHVKGREVELPAFKNGVARARFHNLCGQPLGPADYLAVAEAVRVLILDDIPRLSSENYNEARRFVTLVDALYEAKVRLIATAADKPESLYLEGEGTFEFERTASRLREMQSEGWGE